jgi:hypothetical protein
MRLARRTAASTVKVHGEGRTLTVAALAGVLHHAQRLADCTESHAWSESHAGDPELGALAEQRAPAPSASANA